MAEVEAEKLHGKLNSLPQAGPETQALPSTPNLRAPARQIRPFPAFASLGVSFLEYFTALSHTKLRIQIPLASHLSGTVPRPLELSVVYGEQGQA